MQVINYPIRTFIDPKCQMMGVYNKQCVNCIYWVGYPLNPLIISYDM